MDKMMFGELLGKLLYLSNQKKSSLAKELGYDISYISKWINSKNLPSPKNASKICKDISNFIVDSLTESTADDIIQYFEFEIESPSQTREFLLKNIEKYLKSSYIETTGNRSKNIIIQETYAQERYNSINYINPRLRKKFLAEDIASYIQRDEKLEIIIYTNIFDTPIEEKKSLATSKKELSSFNKCENLNIKFLTGFEYSKKDILINSMIVLEMISSYPNLNFEIYNCEVAKSTGSLVIKDKLLYFGVFRSDGASLLTNISKEKQVVNEFYFSIESMLKTQGNLIYEKKSSIELIKEATYMQYMMGHDLRWIIGNINELFMPEDLFTEISEEIFGDDENILNKLRKINIFLQNITYKSDLKVLIYESEIRKYISSGEISFFNIPIKLTVKQRERHLKFLEKIMKDSKVIEVRMIEGKIVDEINNEENPSIFLSKNLKIIKMNMNDKMHGYVIVTDDNLKNMCDDLFDTIWEEKSNLVSRDKGYILDRISKAIDYMKIINEKF